MKEDTQYLLVDAKALPDVFLKVLHAKQLLAQGKAASLSDATKIAGVSRSAFYKYRDSVFAYQSDSARPIATLYAELLDEPGVLSSLLAVLWKLGANIITINQNIPVDGVAPISISMRIDPARKASGELVKTVKAVYGVVDIRLLANE
jgi:ACT domain-containing protein